MCTPLRKQSAWAGHHAVLPNPSRLAPTRPTTIPLSPAPTCSGGRWRRRGTPRGSPPSPRSCTARTARSWPRPAAGSGAPFGRGASLAPWWLAPALHMPTHTQASMIGLAPPPMLLPSQLTRPRTCAPPLMQHRAGRAAKTGPDRPARGPTRPALPRGLPGAPLLAAPVSLGLPAASMHAQHFLVPSGLPVAALLTLCLPVPAPPPTGGGCVACGGRRQRQVGGRQPGAGDGGAPPAGP